MIPLFVALTFASSPNPEPPPPPPKRPPIAGEYWMDWGVTTYRACFSKNGNYFARSKNGGALFEGKWELNGDILVISERSVPGGTRGYVRTSFELAPGKRECVRGFFRLRPTTRGKR